MGELTEACRAKLFPVPNNVLRDFFIWAGQPVHPIDAAYCRPTEGPQAADCIRDHPADPWHWDGRGTWWRS